MKKALLRTAFLSLLATGTLLSCSNLSCSKSDGSDRKVILTGSSTVVDFLPKVKIEIVVEDALVERAIAIARDGICVIVHRKNPVKTLSDEQVIAIYTGGIENWKQVGGADAPITVVNKAEGRATLDLFLHYFALKNSDIHPDVVIGDNEQGIKTVAGNPDAIGYVSIGTAEYDATNGVPIKLLPVNGVAATLNNVGNGSFPLSRPLNLVTKSEPTGLARDFIEFARSKQVHDIVKEQYFVPLAK